MDNLLIMLIRHWEDASTRISEDQRPNYNDTMQYVIGFSHALTMTGQLMKCQMISFQVEALNRLAPMTTDGEAVIARERAAMERPLV